MSTMRCSRRKKAGSAGRLRAVAQEMEGLRQKLDQQRVKFDIALAEAQAFPAAQEWDMAAVAVAPAVIWA